MLSGARADFSNCDRYREAVYDGKISGQQRNEIDVGNERVIG